MNIPNIDCITGVYVLKYGKECYVGQTKNIHNRLKHHRYKLLRKQAQDSRMNHWNVESIDVEWYPVCDTSKLDDVERSLIYQLSEDDSLSLFNRAHNPKYDSFTAVGSRRVAVGSNTELVLFA